MDFEDFPSDDDVTFSDDEDSAQVLDLLTLVATKPLVVTDSAPSPKTTAPTVDATSLPSDVVPATAEVSPAMALVTPAAFYNEEPVDVASDAAPILLQGVETTAPNDEQEQGPQLDSICKISVLLLFEVEQAQRT